MTRSHRYFIVGIRPVRLRALPDGGLACESFDWSTGQFTLDNGYLTKVVSGYGEVDEVSESEFEAAVKRLRKERNLPAG